jgi:hypothetical protein
MKQPVKDVGAQFLGPNGRQQIYASGRIALKQGEKSIGLYTNQDDLPVNQRRSNAFNCRVLLNFI